MNEETMQELLGLLLESEQCEEEVSQLLDDDEGVADTDNEVMVQTFADAQVLTSNKGLVVRVGRKEFQLQIIQSR